MAAPTCKYVYLRETKDFKARERCKSVAEAGDDYCKKHKYSATRRKRARPDDDDDDADLSARITAVERKLDALGTKLDTLLERLAFCDAEPLTQASIAELATLRATYDALDADQRVRWKTWLSTYIENNACDSEQLDDLIYRCVPFGHVTSNADRDFMRLVNGYGGGS